MTAPDYRAALHAAVEAARAAGRMLRDEFHRPGGPTMIDVEAETLVHERLRAATPWNHLGGESGPIPGSDPSHCWVLTHDGTKHYLQGRRGSAVAIALLRGAEPVLGVVFAFAWPDDDGDLFAWASGCGPLTRNGAAVEAKVVDADLDDPKWAFHDGLIVYVSPGAEKSPRAHAACVRPARHVTLPSLSHRLALVAAGEGVAALSPRGPPSERWAAGYALLQAAGGACVDGTGRPVVFSADGRCRFANFFGGGSKAVEALRKRDWQSVLAPAPVASTFELSPPARGGAAAEAGRLARAQGCLLGQLAGDALGSLVEFRGVEEIRQRYSQGVRHLRDGGTWGNLAGQPTDDSELALMLARTLVRLGRHEPGAVLDAYLHWWPRAWDRGGTISRSLGPASAGATTAERQALAAVSANTQSQSNGSLMRISPLGIFGAGRPDAVADWARADSRLTHPNPVCQDACAVFTTALAHAVAAGGTETAYSAALAEAARPHVQPSVRQAVADARHEAPADYVSQMGYVLIALQNAFYQLLHAPTLEEGIVDTVMRGGDTDTTAAIAGALLGAVHGRQAVPPRWLRTLLCCRPLAGTPTRHPQPPEFWPVDALELAEALLLAGSAV